MTAAARLGAPAGQLEANFEIHLGSAAREDKIDSLAIMSPRRWWKR